MKRELTYWKKPKGVLRALNALDRKGVNSREGIPAPKLKKSSQVANCKAPTLKRRSNDKPGKYNSPISSMSSNARRGILKNNSIIRKASSTVKFRQENEINSSESERGKILSETSQKDKKEADSNHSHFLQQQNKTKIREALKLFRPDYSFF